MATIVKERIVNVVLFYNLTGNMLSCTLHYGCDTALAGDSPDKFQTAWQTAVLAIWQDAVSSDVSFQRIYTYAITAALARPGNDNLNAKAGTIAVEAIPENTACVFQLRQDDVSSKNNGRVFISGLTEAQVVDGLVTTTAAGAELKDLADALLLEITDADGRKYKLVALQKSAAGAPITPVGHTVSVITVTRALATQRRRKTELRAYA